MHRYIWTAVILLSLMLSVPGVARAGLEATTYTGTGFVIHPDGFLLTCAHLIDYGDADSVTVTLDGRTFPASVLDYDYMHDIALLQIQAQNLPSLPLANSNAVRLGEEVRAVGYPLQGVAGGGIKMTRGSIAGITTIGTQKTFQIDAPINSGNSGGPIVNERGEVVGIVNAKLTMEGVEGVGFAVPVNYARAQLRNEFIEPLTLEQGEKLDGPTLAERVTPAVAFLTVETTEWVEGDEEEDAEDYTYVADVLTAKRIELVDDDGKVLGLLSVVDGEPALSLFDTEGNNRAEFRLMDKDPALTLYDKAGVSRGMFGLGEGVPFLSLFDSEAKSRGRFVLGDDGAVIIMSDAEEPRIFLGLLNGQPNMVLADTAGKERVWFRLDNGKPNLALFDVKDKLIWHAP